MQGTWSGHRICPLTHAQSRVPMTLGVVVAVQLADGVRQASEETKLLC